MNALDRPIAVRVAATCHALGFSDRTAESYGHRLVCFEDWIGLSAMEAGQAHAAAWLISTASAPRCTIYINRCALVFLFRHLRDEELDPRVVPRMRNPPAHVRRVADPHEIARVFSAIYHEPSSRLCRLVYATGMRISEAAAARIGDIEAASNSLLVRHGKGGRQRRTIMPDSQLALVAKACRGWPSSSPIVTSNGHPDGGPIGVDKVREQLHDARNRAGIGPHVTVHQLRHCFATHLHERGVGLVELQRMLGHSSVLITMHYIGLRDERRSDIARIGDLDAALPTVGTTQLHIWPTG